MLKFSPWINFHILLQVGLGLYSRKLKLQVVHVLVWAAHHHLDMGALSLLNGETFERMPTPLFDRLLRCSALGHFFARLWYIYAYISCVEVFATRIKIKSSNQSPFWADPGMKVTSEPQKSMDQEGVATIWPLNHCKSSNQELQREQSNTLTYYHNVAKEHPWAEHLTSLSKRGVGALSKECLCHIYSDQMPFN